MSRKTNFCNVKCCCILINCEKHLGEARSTSQCLSLYVGVCLTNVMFVCVITDNLMAEEKKKE